MSFAANIALNLISHYYSASYEYCTLIDIISISITYNYLLTPNDEDKQYKHEYTEISQ